MKTTFFAGVTPTRMVGEQFRPLEPLCSQLPYLVERLMHEELPDNRLAALEAHTSGAYLTKDECLLFAERLKHWADDESCDYIAWLIDEEADGVVPRFLLPRLFRERVWEFCQFLRHCGGFMLFERDDEEDDDCPDSPSPLMPRAQAG